MKIARVFRNEFKALGITINDLVSDGVRMDTEIYHSQTQDIYDDTMQITEFWYRQPEDGKEVFKYYIDGKTIEREVEWEAGDIACSIMIGNREIKRIPKYWEKTGKQNKIYPFIKYCKIPINKSFWDMSELTPILDLVDAADRETVALLLNDAFAANDIILMPEHALADDTEMENVPGAIWKIKSGVPVGAIQRLAGLSNLNGGLKDTITFIGDHIKNTVGLYDLQNGGAPPANVKTLGGLVELKQNGEKRQSLKKADRDAGFENLFELVDWTALEFYDTNRMIFLGAEGDIKDQTQIQANGMMSQEQQIEYAQQQQTIQEQAQQTGQQVPPQQPPNMDRKQGAVIFQYNSENIKSSDGYYPRIDAVISVGDGIVHNKAFTLAALETISNMNINVSNYKIVLAIIDVMQLPNRKEIKEFMENYFGNLQLGIPKTTIAYKDLDPTAKVQMAQKIGIQIQPPTQTDAQGVPWDILAQNQPNVNGKVPLESQVQGQPQQGSQQLTPQQQQMLNDLVSQAHVHLTPLEIQHLTQHPELLKPIIEQYGGNQ